MKILVFDQASYRTGFALFNGKKLSKVGLISIKKDTPANERVHQMSTEIEKLIDEHKPKVVVFEDILMKTSVATTILLAHIQGTIMQMCYDRGISYEILAPSQWRKLLNMKQGRVKREELKANAVRLVEETFCIKANDDTAEAVAMGMAYLYKTRLILNLDDFKEKDYGKKIKRIKE